MLANVVNPKKISPDGGYTQDAQKLVYTNAGDNRGDVWVASIVPGFRSRDDYSRDGYSVINRPLLIVCVLLRCVKK
jgi:hypothetical protein